MHDFLFTQKEREYGKEMKRKTDEMKAKIYSLRTQKMELDRRLIEMRSTIDSLKDEQKVMESALEEKQNEIKMQRAVIDSSREDSQLIDLKEILKQKEAEIEDLRQRLAYPAKVWSVSTDDPSNPTLNLTDTSSMEQKDKSDTSLRSEKGGELHVSADLIDGENSTRVQDRNEKSVGDTNSREMKVEHLQKLEISQDEGFQNGSSIEGKSIDEGKRKQNNIANSTEPIVDASGDVQKLRNNSSDVKYSIEHTSRRESESEKLQTSQEDERQEVQAISEGGKKLEMLDLKIDAGSRLRGKHGHVSRTKGKRWRALAKNRISEYNGLASMRNRRFYRLNQDELRSRRESQASNEGVEKSWVKNTSDNPMGVQETVDSTDAKLIEVNPENAESTRNRDENADPNQQVQQESEILKKLHNSPDREIVQHRSINDETANILSYAGKQRSGEVRQPEEGASTIQQKLSSRDNYEQGNIDIDANKHMMMDDMRAADMQESETETTSVGSFRESASSLEDDKEEYKGEIDESEF